MHICTLYNVLHNTLLSTKTLEGKSSPESALSLVLICMTVSQMILRNIEWIAALDPAWGIGIVMLIMITCCQII